MSLPGICSVAAQGGGRTKTLVLVFAYQFFAGVRWNVLVVMPFDEEVLSRFANPEVTGEIEIFGESLFRSSNWRGGQRSDVLRTPGEQQQAQKAAGSY